MSRIQLTLVNYSASGSNPEVVIIQKNQVSLRNGKTIAWRVFNKLAPSQHVLFFYCTNFTIGCSDDYGNHSPQSAAIPGKLYSVLRTDAGIGLKLSGNAFAPDEIDISNNLSGGATNAWVFNEGLKMAGAADIVPGQTVNFHFIPQIWVGVASEAIIQGQELDGATISEIASEINLGGIRSADLVMTGGGKGPSAQPYRFTLENVVAV